jgi:hypothetical protein
MGAQVFLNVWSFAMKGLKRKISFLLSTLLITGCSLRAQKGPQESIKSCLRFVQSFYNWYVANALKDPDVEPWHVGLKYKGNPFSSELTQALIESDAEAKAEGDPVLDFDPILASQDPADRYVVRSVKRKDGRYWANVYGIWSTPPSDQGEGPQVVAELIFKNGRWLFVNFHYPGSGATPNVDLMKILRSHRSE